MDAQKLKDAATPRALSGYLAKLAKEVGPPQHAHASVRVAEHRGHRIELHTKYQLFVDGREIHLPLGVGDDGQVHCHALPNYQSASALDVAKLAIDAYPDDFAPGEHGHEHGGHAGHGAARKKTRAPAARTADQKAAKKKGGQR